MSIQKYLSPSNSTATLAFEQIRGNQALVLSGLLLQRVFDHNQEEFTKATPETIPTLAVIEEAQSVLGGSAGTSGDFPPAYFRVALASP